MVSPVKRKQYTDQTLTSKNSKPKFRALKISGKYYMFYFTWLYLVRRTSHAGTTTNLQIVLNTPKNQATPQKYLPRIKNPKKPSILLVTWNPKYPPLRRFSKSGRFLKKLFPRPSNCLRLDSKLWKLVNSCGVVKQLVLPERDEWLRGRPILNFKAKPFWKCRF